MPVKIDITIVPFGQIRWEAGKPVPSVEESLVVSTEEVIRYSEPRETAPRTYEVQYGERLVNYVVPLSTG